MDWLATLRRSGGMDALARQTGTSPAAVRASLSALVPAFVARLGDHVRKLGGGGAGIRLLLGYLADFGDGKLAVEVMSPDPVDPGAGDAILARIVGDAAARRRLITDAAASSGQNPDAIERLLPLLAMLVCGYISARAEAAEAQGAGLDWLRDALALPGGG